MLDKRISFFSLMMTIMAMEWCMIMKSKYDFNVDGDYIDSDDGGVNGDGDGGAPLH